VVCADSGASASRTPVRQAQRLVVCRRVSSEAQSLWGSGTYHLRVRPERKTGDPKVISSPILDCDGVHAFDRHDRAGAQACRRYAIATLQRAFFFELFNFQCAHRYSSWSSQVFLPAMWRNTLGWLIDRTRIRAKRASQLPVSVLAGPGRAKPHRLQFLEWSRLS
jgi:hypothetical protein